jgi:uncharacterized protein (TIGR02217 family)
MPVEFIESPRFPDNIAYGSSGGPGFKTHIFEGFSAIEQRSQLWSRVRYTYDVSYGIRDKDDMDLVRAHFIQMRGRAVGFRFKDHSDYELVEEVIGTGDGADTTWPIIKTYGAGGSNPYQRRIFKPVSGTVQVWVNNVSVPVDDVSPSASECSVNYTTGIITFGASVIPGVGHAIEVSCEFDVPVRYDTDDMKAAHEGWLTESWGSIPLVELLLE